MEDRRSIMKGHVFIGILSITFIIALIVLTIHFFKTTEFNPASITGFVICYVWIPSILPAGYYIRADINSFYQRQPKFIFHRIFFQPLDF